MWARVVEGIVFELIDLPAEELAARYHPDFVADLVPVGHHSVAVGDTWDGQQFGGPPPPPPLPVPATVSKLQLVRALRQAELKAAFDMALAAASDEVREDWSLAVEIRREDPLVAAFAAALSVSPEVVDDLFRLAASLL